MSSSLHEGVGLPSLPFADADDTTLASLDPGRDILLNLLADALNSELTARWDDATTGTPLAGTSPVQDRVPFPLTETVVKARANFCPLLSVARADGEPSTFDELTLWQWRLTQQWDVEYVLGPLTVGNERKLRDVLTAAVKIVLLTIRRGSHLAHRDGELVLGQAGFSSVRVVNYNRGPAKFGDAAPSYHMMTLRLETTELTSFADDATDFNGASFNIGADLPDLYVFDTD